MQHNPTHSQKVSNTLKVYHTQSTISSFYDMSALGDCETLKAA